MKPEFTPGEVVADGSVTEFYPDRERTRLQVRNTGDHIVQVGSHYHFFEANPALGFDRLDAFGRRLSVPPGDRVLFPPGETVTVALVPYGGDNRVRGFYGVVNGPVEDVNPQRALETFHNQTAEPVAAPPADEP
jgi:urease subunit beta